MPVTVITGFLGAGKTTLIRHLMQNPQGRAAGRGGERIRRLWAWTATSCGPAPMTDCPVENIVELANGCICCTVADDFIPTIEALMALDPRPDHILIETSGLALPKPLLKAFDWPAIRSRITVDGVIALADAEAVAAGRFAPDVARGGGAARGGRRVDHETPLCEVFEDQIACADLVLLTKADLAGCGRIGRGAGGDRGRGAAQPAGDRGAGGRGRSAGHPGPRGGGRGRHRGAGPRITTARTTMSMTISTSVVIELPEQADPQALAARVSALAEARNILRVKGYVAVTGKPMRLLVQAVGARVRVQYDRPWAPGEVRRGRLVVIAEQDDIDTRRDPGRAGGAEHARRLPREPWAGRDGDTGRSGAVARQIWWSCRSRTATLGLSRRAGTGRGADCRRCGWRTLSR